MEQVQLNQNVKDAGSGCDMQFEGWGTTPPESCDEENAYIPREIKLNIEEESRGYRNNNSNSNSKNANTPPGSTARNPIGNTAAPQSKKDHAADAGNDAGESSGPTASGETGQFGLRFGSWGFGTGTSNWPC
ncbi:predicted protein [Histoplasma capsulatum var. duboisii H88]|uniref:Predicted protein n=1 Tax=Ajellomyces capsulatus (strain H88) TaxID=544711 RepID=F0UM14_AJEC8|nr:predicted protein [Histoplasma capsulatum var. duboisii H88]